MGIRTPFIAGGSDSAETFRLALSGLYVPNSAINARTGITTPPSLTGTGNFTASIGPFTCVIDGTSNSLQGSYPVTNDAATTVTITAANTQPRIDLISLQIQDNAYDSSGFQRGIFVVTAGTPAGSPVAPATPANAIPLFTVPVAANATSVTWGSASPAYSYTAMAGGIVPVRNSSDQPPVPNGVQYRHRLDVTAAAGATSPLESSTNGATWTPVFDAASITPTWTAVTAAGSFGSGLSCSKFGGVVTLRGNVTAASATWTASTFSALGTLPAGYAPAVDHYMPGMFFAGSWNACIIHAAPSGALQFASVATVTSTANPYCDGISFSL